MGEGDAVLNDYLLFYLYCTFINFALSSKNVAFFFSNSSFNLISSSLSSEGSLLMKSGCGMSYNNSIAHYDFVHARIYQNYVHVHA